MTGRLCLDCIWAISYDSVALFVSHCDKVLWLSIIIPSRSEGSFPNSIFQLSRSYSRHKKCMKKNKNKKTAPQLGCVFIFVSETKTRSTLLLPHMSLTDAFRHTCDQLTPCNCAILFNCLQSDYILGQYCTWHGLCMQVCPGLWH